MNLSIAAHGSCLLYTSDIGFRTIQVKSDQVLLNGKPIFLRGVSIHEEAPYRSGRAWSEQDSATLLGWAHELHCNFVRLVHYPHVENETRLADKPGIMVWSEIPVWVAIDWTDPHALEICLLYTSSGPLRRRESC